MKHLFDVLFLSLVQAWDSFDRWLCLNLHWSIRPWWCSLWIRKDEFHPSLDSDYTALTHRIILHKKLLQVWFDAKRLYPKATDNDRKIEQQILLGLEKRMWEEHSLDLVRRRNIAHDQDAKAPSLS